MTDKLIHELRKSNQTLLVLTGNIGLGKSTFAKTQVDDGFVVVSCDDISSGLMAGITGTLHGAQYAKLCKLLYENTIYESLRLGFSVIADDLNLRSSERKFLCSMAAEFNVSTISVDFGDGTEQGLKRRAQSSSSFSYQGLDIMYQDLKDKYQKPHTEEGFSFIINKEAI